MQIDVGSGIRHGVGKWEVGGGDDLKGHGVAAHFFPLKRTFPFVQGVIDKWKLEASACSIFLTTSLLLR